MRDVILKGLARKAVINMSIGGTQTLNRMPKLGDGEEWNYVQAVRALLLFGVPVVVSSGNMAVCCLETL